RHTISKRDWSSDVCSSDLSKAAYQRALIIAQSPEHGDPSTAMDILLWLGFLRQTQGRTEAALAAYGGAIEVAQRLRHRHRLARKIGRASCREGVECAGGGV